MAKNIEAKSEVTGSIWKVLKQIGESVEEGDVLMIIESMKMEIPVLAERAGKVAELCVQEGASVAEGDTVMYLECAM